jgi:hypothetical protein
MQAPYSNRDAFERMQITCKSIVDSAPEGVSTGAAVTPLGEVFGAVDMDQISDFLTGAKYADNARKFIQLAEKGKPGMEPKNTDLAKKVLASYEYHNAYVSYNKMEGSADKKLSTVQNGMVTYTSPINFFKAVHQMEEEGNDATKSMIPILHGLSKDLIQKWMNSFDDVDSQFKTHSKMVTYNQFRAWNKSLADPEMKNQPEKKATITKNIETFKKLMEEYGSAVKRIPPTFVPTRGFIPHDWKEFGSKKMTRELKNSENIKAKPKGNGGGPPHHENNGRGNGNYRPQIIHNHFHGDQPRTNAGIDLVNDWAETFSTGMPMEGGEYPLVSTGSAAPAFGSSLASGKNQGNMKPSASRFCQCGPDCVPVPIHTGVDSAAAGAVSGIVPRKPLAQQALVKTASKDGDFCKCKTPLVETTGTPTENLENAVRMMKAQRNLTKRSNNMGKVYNRSHANTYMFPHGKSGRRRGHHMGSEYSDGTPLLF